MRLNLELLNRSYVKEGISHPWVGVGRGLPLRKGVVLLLYRAIRPLSGFLLFTNCRKYDLELSTGLCRSCYISVQLIYI